MAHPIVIIRPGRRDPNAPRPPLRERIAAMRLVPRLIRLVWETQPVYTMMMIVLRLARSVIPVTNLWIAKLIIDEGVLLARASGLIESLLGDLFTNRISIRIMEHAATLDLHQFEDPKFYDHLERARQGTTGRISLLMQIVGIGQSILTLVSLSVALAAQAPWLLALLVAAVLPGFLGETHFASLSYSLLFRRTPQRRQLDYVRWVG